jgi:hypothetical protein
MSVKPKLGSKPAVSSVVSKVVKKLIGHDYPCDCANPAHACFYEVFKRGSLCVYCAEHGCRGGYLAQGLITEAEWATHKRRNTRRAVNGEEIPND